MLGLLEMFGTNLTMPHRRKLQPNLFELRIRGGQEIRIFYSFRNDTAILLHAFIKKTQKLPPGEMQIALNRLKNLKIK